MIDINTTPLIDVMLVLLIMLIITIPIQLHAVNLNMPTGNPPPPLVKPEVVKHRHRLRRASSTGTARPCPTAPTLEDNARRAAAQAVQPEVHLRPDKAVEVRGRGRVMASAQRLGLTKIGIVGSEQFINE